MGIFTFLPFFFVDLVPKAHCVNNSQFEVDVALLQVVGSRAQVDAVLVMAGLLIFEHCIKKRVH